MDRDVERIILPASKIRERVKELAQEISQDYANLDLMIVSILKGSVVFLADLVRRLTIPCELSFMAVSSYNKGARSSGVVRMLMDLEDSPQNRDLLLVEDILDTGLTLQYVLKNLRIRGARSVSVCALLDKHENRKVVVPAHYVGFKIPNEFVVGYGLDYCEKYRQLPYIGILKEEVIKHEK